MPAIQPNDIIIGADGSITIWCSTLNINQIGGPAPTTIVGEVEFTSRVWLTIPDYYTPPAEPEGMSTFTGARVAGSVTVTGADAATSLLPFSAYSPIPTPGKGGVVSSPVSPLDVIRGRIQYRVGRIELSDELALLRAAILELYDMIRTR
jgi:hypothetical protein